MWHKLNGMVLKDAMAALVVLGLLGSRPTLAAVAYTVVDLHPSGFVDSVCRGVGGGHQVGFGVSASTSQAHALLWNGTAGGVVDLNPINYDNVQAWGISGTQQVGFGGGPATYGSYNYHALLWNGTPQSYIDLNGNNSQSRAYGTNGIQQVGYFRNTNTGNSQHACLWNGSANSVIDLHPNGFGSSEAYAIDGGKQVGNGFVIGYEYHALLWSGTAASVVDLHPSGYSYSYAYDIRGTQVVGYGHSQPNSGEHALLWSGTAGSVIDLNPVGFTRSSARGTNGLQQVGGGRGTSTDSRDHALMWSGTAGSVVDLHQFLGAGFRYSFAYSIDAQGNIGGQAWDGLGNSHAILWVPVPESSTIVLLGMGVIGLFAWIWRRGRRAVLFAMPKMCVAFVLFTPAIGLSNPIEYTGLTIDVTGPGGMGVKEVQPGPMTGEIWATVRGTNLIYTDDALNAVTGGLLLQGSGSFLPFDIATNYLPPWNGSTYPVDLSPDGKTLGHGGLQTISGTGVLWFRSTATQVGNGPFKLGTFQANLEAGDSIQFLLSGQSVQMYLFKVDNYVATGISAFSKDFIHLGEPLVAVPEPSMFVLLGMGVFGFLVWVWRGRGRKAGD